MITVGKYAFSTDAYINGKYVRMEFVEDGLTIEATNIGPHARRNSGEGEIDLSRLSKADQIILDELLQDVPQMSDIVDCEMIIQKRIAQVGEDRFEKLIEKLLKPRRKILFWVI